MSVPILGTLAIVPDIELSRMKIVVVAAVVFGFAMPAKINIGAKYTPPPIPVRPATTPTKAPTKTFMDTLRLTIRRGYVASITAKPPIAITIPMTILRIKSGSTSRPARKAAGTEPTRNQRNSLVMWTFHLVNELVAEKMLKIRPPNAASPPVRPTSRRRAVKSEPPANPAIV